MKFNDFIENLGKVATLINSILADEYLLYSKTRYALRDINKINSNGSVKLFKSQLKMMDTIINSTSDRVKLLGRSFPVSLHNFLKEVSLSKPNGHSGDQDYIIKSLLKDHEILINLLIKDIITIREIHKDSDTSYFLLGILEKHKIMSGILRSHLN